MDGHHMIGTAVVSCHWAPNNQPSGLLNSVLFSSMHLKVSLVPRSRPAFRRLHVQYGKLGGAWERGYSKVAYRAAERIGGAQGKYKTWGPRKWIMWGGSGGSPPGNFEILHALKCVLGAPEALFRECTQYIYTCKLPSSISGFRLESTTCGALASGTT